MNGYCFESKKDLYHSLEDLRAKEKTYTIVKDTNNSVLKFAAKTFIRTEVLEYLESI